MSLIKGNHGGLGGAGAPGGALGSFYSHTLDQSLRFDHASSTVLHRTPSSSSNRSTWSFSCWLKRGKLTATSTNHTIFSAGTNVYNRRISLDLNVNDTLNLFMDGRADGASYYNFITDRVFRDPSAWYHILAVLDTTDSTADDRIKLYVNGEQQSGAYQYGHGAPPQDSEWSINHTYEHDIGDGHHDSVTQHFDGYLAEIHFVDGTALTPSSFGETKDGIWIAKEYSGSHGTNGFHLTFADSNYIGRDKSGSKTLVTSPSFSTFGGGDTNFTSTEYAEAFDNILSTDCDRTGSGGIIDITPSSSVTPVSHTMINASSSAYTAASRPNSVLLQGSNDGGSNWTTIDDLTNGSGSNTITTSSFSNTTSYAKLRLNISENHGGSNTRFAQYIVIASEDNGDGENIFFPTNLAAHDVVPDSPTNNFGVMNVLDFSSMTVTEGGLKVVPSGDYKAIRGNFGIPTSGKWYFEARILTPGGGNVQDNQIGVTTKDNVLTGSSPYPQAFTYGVGYIGSGQINRGGSAAQTSLTAFTAGKILGVAVNVDDDEVQFYLDGSAVGTTEQLVSTTEPNFAFCVGATSRGAVFNFGQDSTFAGAVSAGGNADANGIGDFAYAPPSGFSALCTSNLSDPTIGPGQSSQAGDHFNSVIYTGNAGSLSITGAGFQPDWLWFKSRSNADPHEVIDSVRGATQRLRPNATDSEYTRSSGDGFVSIDSDGFTLNGDGGGGQVNGSSRTYVSWLWKAGTAFSNDASATGVGSLDSTGSVNQAAGFAIISYTGTIQTGETVAHGLGGVPELIIAKNRDSAANWVVFTKDLTTDRTLYLNLTNAQNNSGTTWGNHTSTVFGVDDDPQSNANGDATIAYLIRSIEGYSKIGTYLGNGSTNGTFVYTGFRPAFLFTKEITATSGWNIRDSVRSPENVVNEVLQPDTNGAEMTSNYDVDFLSNGFKLRTSLSDSNTSGQTYMYWAIAEAPFKFANAR